MEKKEIRVLLIDDEEELIDYLSKRLLRAGFTVTATTSGAQALEVATAEDFDVAIVDLKMPGIDGIETQRQLKEIRPFLQTIVLTGHGSIDTALESGKHDAFLFLAKPAEHEQLVQAIIDAKAHKKELLYDQFREEMEQITSSGGSPKEIVHAVDQLRNKYGLR